MKKIMSVILLITIIFSLVSCGKPKELKELEKLTDALSKVGTEEGIEAFKELAESLDIEDSDEDYDVDYDYDAEDSDDYDYDLDDYGVDLSGTPGSELTDFYSFYDNAISQFSAVINNWETDDFFMMDAAMDYYMPSIHFVSMTLYDALYIFGTDRGEYKDVDGDIIRFGQEYTREEDGWTANDKKGDVMVEKGILDNSAKTLYFETYTERDGEKISRAVSEVVCLSDGTFIAQTFKKSLPFDERLEDKGDAYFLVFNSDRLEVIKAKFEPDVNFTYKSIIGNGKTSVEDMAQGYTLIRKMTVADGVASVDKY